MESLTITWETTTSDPNRTAYFVDGSAVGEDDRGFDRVLEIIRSRDAKVIVKILSISSFGGDSLINTLPFSKRFEEFRSCVGKKGYVYEFF